MLNDLFVAVIGGIEFVIVKLDRPSAPWQWSERAVSC